MFRAAPLSSLIIEPLDDLAAVYHRASGITHLLASPAPELLHILQEPMPEEALLVRLESAFELADADQLALRARLDELVASGLVERL